jgi:hypothetical protein
MTRQPLFVYLTSSFFSLAACATPADDATVVVDTPSESAAAWHPVADYLDHRCGSLDCHGDSQRNLIIYGCSGLRLDPHDVPGCPPLMGAQATTAAEYAATFRSLVGLEPDVMSEVVESRDPDIDLLTFVRKARGEEAHKGGTLITAGDVQDRCLDEWLSGASDTADCRDALASTP